jgi:hypothetical protein
MRGERGVELPCSLDEGNIGVFCSINGGSRPGRSIASSTSGSGCFPSLCSFRYTAHWYIYDRR